MPVSLGISLIGVLVVHAYCAFGLAACRANSPAAGAFQSSALAVETSRRVTMTILLVKRVAFAAAVAITALLTDHWGSGLSGVAIPISAALLLLASEIGSARFAAGRPAGAGVFVSPFVRLSQALRPVVSLMSAWSIGLPASERNGGAAAELVTLAEAVHGGGIKERERQLIRNIFQFDDTRASAIMTPRPDMFVIDAERPLEFESIFRSGFSRIPVIAGDIDHVIGIVHIKDVLLRQCDRKPMDLRSVMREAYFVPENKTLDALLQGFKRRRQHMAIVVDEHGGVSGLITLEDTLEELVGEITDETDVEESVILAVRPGEWRVKGKADIDRVNAELRMHIPDIGEYGTFSGYVLSRTGRIPRQSEELRLDGFVITVTARAGNRILEYHVRTDPALQPEPAACLAHR
jgi:CBS domain containing-hemolysin-like protein